MSISRSDERQEKEFEQDTFINLLQEEPKGSSETQWVQSQSQAPDVGSQPAITALGAAFKQPTFQFWFGFCFSFGCERYPYTLQTDRQLHLGSTWVDGGVSVPPHPTGTQAAVHPASLHNTWGRGRSPARHKALGPKMDHWLPQVSVTDWYLGERVHAYMSLCRCVFLFYSLFNNPLN